MKFPCLIPFFSLDRNFKNGLGKWKQVALRFTSDLLDMIACGLGKKIRHRISLVELFLCIPKEHHLQYWALPEPSAGHWRKGAEELVGVPHPNESVGHA